MIATLIYNKLKFILMITILMILTISTIKSYHYDHNRLNKIDSLLKYSDYYGSISFYNIKRFRFLNKAMKHAITIIDEDINSANKYSNIKNEISISNLINEDQTPLEFADNLKQLAVKRKIKLNSNERLEVFRTFLTFINQMNHEEVSNSIWALGILNITVNDFTEDVKDFNITNTTTSSNVNDQLTAFLLSIDRCYQFENRILISSSTTSLRVNILRTVSGLGKMKFKWNDIPMTIKDCFIKHTSLLNDSDLLLSRELSSAFYTLGQLEASKCDFSLPYLNKLLYYFGNDVVMQGFTTQGFVNALHGIAHIGITWSDLNTTSYTSLILEDGGVQNNHKSINESDHMMLVSLQDKILRRSEELLPKMRADEFCSFLNSLALLKYNIDGATYSFKSFIFNALLSNIPLLIRREIVNIIWSLGKINLKYKVNASVQDSNLISQVKSKLCNRLEIVAKVPHIKSFDLESLLIGFSLMEINFADLSEAYQIILIEVIESNLSQMNIFALHNTLLGLAKMKATIQQIKPKLTSALLDKTMLVLHTFLPIHYGDVIWSLGAIGYSIHSNIDKSQSDRLLAIVSRVFGTLHVKAAAYLLQGLSYMGYLWADDFLIGTCSLPYGREAPPLANSITRYIRQRVCSMREHEFSVMISSLGDLQTQWDLLPSYAREKIDHRITRVASFLTSNSLSTLISGLSQMNMMWEDLSTGSKLVLENCLVMNNTFIKGINNNNKSNSNNDKSNNNIIKFQGFSGMNSHEFAIVVYSLGKMNFILDGKDTIKHELYRKLDNILLNDDYYRLSKLDMIYLINGLLDLNISSFSTSPKLTQFIEQHVEQMSTIVSNTSSITILENNSNDEDIQTYIDIMFQIQDYRIDQLNSNIYNWKTSKQKHSVDLSLSIILRK